MNNKCLRHSINRIQKTYPKEWISWISSWLLKLIKIYGMLGKSYIDNYPEQLFCQAMKILFEFWL